MKSPWPHRLTLAGLALLALSCAHAQKADDTQDVEGPPPPQLAPPAYVPERGPQREIKHYPAISSPAANPADRPRAISGAALQFGDGTLGTFDKRWVDGGALEWVTTWRSEVPVQAFATYARGREVCLATNDGRVGCLLQTNRYGPQVDWVYGADARSLAVFRSGAGWHLCLVRSDGSTHCESLRTGWPVEDGAQLTFKHSTPSEDQARQTERLDQTFQQLGSLKKLFAEPDCAIDAENRLWCLEGTGVRLVLAGVLDATPECALMVDHTVRCWGANNFGQLGNGRRSSGTSAPTPVVGLKDVVQVVSSGVNACAVRRDGAVFCWGANFGPDFPPAAAKIPVCRVQPRPPPPPEKPCPPVGPGGDDVCGRQRYNAQRMGGGDQSPIVLRDGDEQCAAPGEDYVPTPTRITAVDRAVALETSHEGVRLIRPDGMVVEASVAGVLDIIVRVTPEPEAR